MTQFLSEIKILQKIRDKSAKFKNAKTPKKSFFLIFLDFRQDLGQNEEYLLQLFFDFKHIFTYASWPENEVLDVFWGFKLSKIYIFNKKSL